MLPRLLPSAICLFSFLLLAGCSSPQKIAIRDAKKMQKRMLAIVDKYDPDHQYIPRELMYDPEEFPQQYQHVDLKVFEQQIQMAVGLGMMSAESQQKSDKYEPLFKEFYAKIRRAKSQTARDSIVLEYADKIPMDINDGDPESWGGANTPKN